MRFVFFIFILLSHASLIHSALVNDRASLVAFLAQTQHSARKFLSWNTSVSVCQWRGVTCDGNQTSVTVLRLPGVGLSGPIPPSTLSLLSDLRVLSLRSNRLSGPIPADFVNLSRLRLLYLHKNRLSGEIPAEIVRMRSLTRLDLSGNELTGEIPAGIGGLKELTGLFLENNKLTGNIQRIGDLGLVGFNVSNNKLGGEVPESLGRFPASSFAGNLNLCGRPLPPCFSSPEPTPTAKFSGSHHGKLSKATNIGIYTASGVVLLLLLLILLVCLVSRRRHRSGGAPGRKAKSTATMRSACTETASSKDERSRGLGEATEKNKLVFFGNSPYSFDLEDLLRASAEVLGKGTLGTSYKALLEDGSVVLVKRLKDVSAAKREFEQQMDVLGKVRHDNVVPLCAYYFSKDEKLLVSNHLPAGSLSAFLHGSRASGRAILDWAGRVRIALSAAKGLAHLHSLNIVHGDVKAANILLRIRPDGAAWSDFGLSILFRKAALGVGIGYRAPEVAESAKATVESDIYGFGIVLLELLTGKAANQAVVAEEVFDLSIWVQSVVTEEWTAEVFDEELVRYDGNKAEEEMVQVLQIAIACVDVTPERRPKIEDVVKVLEEVDSKMESSDDPSPSANTTP